MAVVPKAVRGWALALALVLPVLPASAAGKDGAAFLSIPAGGRPAALGGAYSALAYDAYAPAWNPSGLGLLPSAQLAGMHLEYAESIGYEFVSYVQPLGAHDGLGGSVSFLHPKRTSARDVDGLEDGSFDAHYAAYTLGYGHAFSGSFALGAAGKVIDARISDASGQAFAADVGALYRVSPSVSVAAVAANLGSTLKLLDEADELPAAYRLGLHLSPVKELSLAAEAGRGGAEDAFGRLGAEWRALPAIALRAGYHSDAVRGLPGLAGVTAGFGLTVYGQRFDYAWSPMGDLGQTHYFSVVFAFGKGAGHE